jgi:hypothetical protein
MKVKENLGGLFEEKLSELVQNDFYCTMSELAVALLVNRKGTQSICMPLPTDSL